MGWQSIKNFKIYEVSVSGLVRNKRTKKVLKPQLDKKGYGKVNLYYKPTKFKSKFVHRLVIETFYGRSNLETNHKDGNKGNNKLSNLEYVTKNDNMKHAVKLGLIHKGTQISTCKLNKHKVMCIRELAKSGVRQVEIAKKFGIDRAHVSKIKDKKYWRYL